MNAIIKVPIANLTYKKKEDVELQDEVLYGSFVNILDYNSDYSKIITHYNFKGYVKTKDLLILTNFNEYPNSLNSIITGNYVDILHEPRYQSYTLISIPKGSYIHCTEEYSLDRKWVKVKLINNIYGWLRTHHIKVRKDYNLKDDEEFLRKSIVNEAKTYIDSQYRWGGKTTLGIDCSGLTSICYLLYEIKIYRNAKFNDDIFKQFNMNKINRNELKPADLIYSPGHVMMYIGNEKYIHATGSYSKVRINSLDPNDSDYREDISHQILGYVSMF